MSPAAEARIDADNRNHRTWDTSFANWQPGPGDVLLRAYSDAVNKRLLGRWLPERCGHALKTDLFDELAGDGLVGLLLSRADTVTGIDIAPTVVERACSRIPDPGSRRRRGRRSSSSASGCNIRRRGLHVNARPLRQ